MDACPSQDCFFREGLRFECTQCGKCCGGEPGIIFVTDREIGEIADALRLERASFTSQYLRSIPAGFSIRERPDGDCVFLEEDRCAIHAVRPMQCRTYPFWFKNLRSEQSWAATCDSCPGIGQGKLHTEEEVLSVVEKDLERVRVLG